MPRRMFIALAVVSILLSNALHASADDGSKQEELESRIRTTLMSVNKNKLAEYMEIYGYILEYSTQRYGSENHDFVFPYMIFDAEVNKLARQSGKFTMLDYRRLVIDCVDNGKNRYLNDKVRNREYIYKMIEYLMHVNYLHINYEELQGYLYGIIADERLEQE